MLSFLLNDQEIHVDRPSGTLLLDFLRDDCKLTGTKAACREGDCGSCMVLLGEWAEGTVVYRPVNACLLPLGDLTGKHLVSVEGLNGEGLNPVQQALVEEGAIQCGFCTPGIVVALTAFFLQGGSLDYPAALEAVSGNLCRCTGYCGIKRAAARLCRQTAFADAGQAERCARLVAQGILPGYFQGIPERLAQLPLPEQHLLPAHETLVAGGTDLFVQQPERLADAPLDFLSRHRELKGVWIQEGRCFIGADTTVEELRESEVLCSHFPGLADDLRLVCSPSVRGRATLGGNLVNASPIGDLAVLFLALRATASLKEKHTQREIALRDFYLGYKVLDKAEQEVLQWVSFELPARPGGYSFEKVSKRQYLDIASVNSALQIQIAGNVIDEVGLSAGGVGPVPLFLADTAGYLAGKPLTADHVRQAAQIAQEEVSPISDVRGSVDYKRLLLRQLIYAHFLKLFPQRLRWEALQ